MYFNYFSLPLFATSLSTFVLAGLVYKRKNFNGYIYYFIALLIISSYSFFYALEISTKILSQASFFYKLEFLTVPFLAVFFFLFCLVYSGRIRRVPPILFFVLLITPAISLILNLSNDYHGYYYTNERIDTSGWYPFFAIEPRKWYFVQQAYEIVLMLASFAIFCKMWLDSKGIFRTQASIFLSGLFITFVSFILTPLGFIPYGIDAVPYALGLNMLISYLALNYLDLFDLVPQARALLLDQMKEGIIVIDRQNRIIDFNHSILEIIPEIANSIGKNLESILSPRDELLQKILHAREDESFEFKINKSNETLWLSVSCKSFKNDNQSLYQGKIITFKDISDLMKVEEKIKEQNLELLKVNNEKDKFFSILAHDLRSPLNGILGLTQIISNEIEELEPDQIKDMVGGMRKASLHLYELLENLLEWGNLQNNNIIFRPEKILVIDLIEEVVHSLGLMISNKSIKVQYELEQNIEIFADNKMIASVLRNLLSNAVKFSQRNNKIILKAITYKQTIQISIQDFGIGIPENYRKNLFQIHVKTNQLGTEGEPSTGIGLIIIKEFIEKHNGELFVESKEGEGSIFTVSLPIFHELSNTSV
ncbi:MAG: ATP-binding protein [Leptospiraceae bacterium]|nr:ATP-binding protein [Leptospiraceae bacterium]